MDIPIAADGDLAVVYGQRMPGKQNMDMLEEALVANRVLEGDVFPKGIRVGRDFRQNWQEGLDLRREIQNAVDDGVKERLDAEPVSCREKPFSIPQCESEHIAEMID